MLAVTGLATSIDALVVGASFAFLDVAIGLCTFVMATLGVMVGRGLGALAGQRAELVGGLVLIGIGAGILVQHLGAAGAGI